MNTRPVPQSGVVLYGKEGCTLCVKAREILERLSQERPFDLKEVDITSDPALYDLYEYWIPVVLVDGREAMRGIPNELALRRALGIEV